MRPPADGFSRNPLPVAGRRRALLAPLYRAPEAAVAGQLAELARLPEGTAQAVAARATALVAALRQERRRHGGLEAFLQEYGLSTREGVALMCLAEALLRVPDAGTADLLIEDKLGQADWAAHLGQGDSLFVNASTWALMLTGRVLGPEDALGRPQPLFQRLAKRLGEPLIRAAMMSAMRILGRQFVLGRTIGEALDRAAESEPQGWRHSFDMLGEAARTAADARHYLEAYHQAIAALGQRAGGRGPERAAGISIKLSALYPRYENARWSDATAALSDALGGLARAARSHDIGLTVDAEEADRLELSLDLFETLLRDPGLAGWDGLGLAVQAYQKRSHALLGWLVAESRAARRRLMIRLVKGAYWDSEIKWAQEQGLPGYPVFTRKLATDTAYLAGLRLLLDARGPIFPQFATHNAHTVATVLTLAGGTGGYEFQRLHGMGEALYHGLVGPDCPVRVYAPVGGHEHLLAYLVRRLLENGANTSFVNRLHDDQVPIAQIIADPPTALRRHGCAPHPRIPLPADLYAPERRNSAGVDLSDPTVLRPLFAAMDAALASPAEARPVVGGASRPGPSRPLTDPADRRRLVGTVVEADDDAIEQAFTLAGAAFPAWNRQAAARAALLDRAADLFERDRARLMALAVREAGKTLPDAVAELREAVDFLRYYAARTRADFDGPRPLPGPAGERNSLVLEGRGTFICISPWNFPLAIFTGQVAAALAAGNCVLAKPAPQTPLMAAAAVALLHEAGIPGAVLHLLPGGAGVGARLVGDRRAAGVAFTGSTASAQAINRALAARSGPIVPLIAETGGQNAMIVDSTALAEQVVGDVLDGAFRSAGQRCSALRVLYLQDECAAAILAMLEGAAATWTLGDPALLATDVGPVIDDGAKARLEDHIAALERHGRLLFRIAPGPDCAAGSFVAPCAYEIDRIERLDGEKFGPILHVIRWRRDQLDQVCDAVAGTGFGLTLGIHSRIDRTVATVIARLRVGNTYVNRNQIGAVVGAQPFGGLGLSGTGPKAGGPHYLQRFACERTISVNTTASGGNAALITLADED